MSRREDAILVGSLEPGGTMEFRHVENTLEAFQALVGGYIETTRVFDNMLTICNEEGRLLDLPRNIAGLRGTLIFCRTRGEEFASLSFKDVVQLRQLGIGGKDNGQGKED